MNALQRPGRAAAIVGGLVAIGAATVMAFASSASAAEQGHCSDNVNVRSQPNASASVVTVCQRGTDVTIGQKRNGYVELTNLHGWAAEQYVSSSAAAPATSPTQTAGNHAATTTPAAHRERVTPTTTAAPQERRAAPATSTAPAHRAAPSPTAAHPAPTQDAPAQDAPAQDAPAAAPAASPPPLTGIVG